MKCLIYVTKSKWHMFFDKNINYYSLSNKKIDNDLNGKIVAEFDGVVEKITSKNLVDYEKTSGVDRISMLKYFKPSLIWDDSFEVLLKTFGDLTLGYAIHIKNLKVFENPYELDCFYRYDSGELKPLKRAPQNMCYAFDIWGIWGNKYVVISVHSEWACKILNGEKTIEVRKQVLNCMKGE